MLTDMSDTSENSLEQLSNTDESDKISAALISKNTKDIKASINDEGLKCFICPHCSKQFRTNASCQMHIRSNHDREERLESLSLDSESPNKSQHRKKTNNKHAGTDKKSYPCTMCETIFTSREGRRVHMILKHNAGKTYKCEQCPMIFARMGNLRLHMTTHGIRPHVCSICGQSFARIESLKNHEEACADGKRGLCCEECGQRFRKRELLDKHLQQGHPEKEFRCNYCGQGFETKRALSHHVRVHEGSFRCAYCPRQFVTENALRNHEKSRHWDILGIERVIGKQGRRNNAPPRQPKERVRRNKNCPFLGLEHLADVADSGKGTSNDEAAKECKNVRLEVKDSSEIVETEVITGSSKNDDVVEKESQRYKFTIFETESLQSEIKIEKTELNVVTCSSNTEDNKLDLKPPVSDDPIHSTQLGDSPSSSHHTADDSNDEQDYGFSDSNLHQTSSSDSDELKSRKLRTKRKSRQKADNTSKKNSHPKKYKCDDCDKSFAHQTSWATHRAKAHGIQEDVQQAKAQRIHFCDECPKSFSDWRNLIYHLKHVHQKKIDEVQFVTCQSCKKNMLSEKDLKLHTCYARRGLLNRPPLMFKCDQCDKAYVSQSRLDNHRLVHEKGHSINCEWCLKPFANEKDLKYHKKRVHVKASFVCEVCGKSFKVQNQLKTHIQIHLGTKGYQCEYCGRAFAQRNGMTAHLRIAHPEQLGEQALAEREISCTICEKKLKGKLCYRLHMKMHYNDRPYSCSYCDKRFVANQDKLRHEQTHTKEYKFRCRFCDKGSTRRKLILLHEAKEHNEFSGEAIGPQHKCSFCGRCFSSPSAVAIHESLHSDALPVVCTLCDRRFKNVKYMKYHLKAHHKQDTTDKKETAKISPPVDGEQKSGTSEQIPQIVATVATDLNPGGSEFIYTVYTVDQTVS